MFPISKQTSVVKVQGNTGMFEIEALYPGYGVTVGNSLRRVLLSSLEGAAVTQVKFGKGVSHEFSTIPGVKEDVVGILLNLKQLRFKAFTEDLHTATLKGKGEKEIKGSDCKLSPQIELINKDLSIAHLTDKSVELEMELQIERGIGYEAAETRKRGKADIGVIAIDAIYTPVVRVSYKVEQMRVGERTDYDRLIVEIETDGTMHPETALKQASEILVQQFGVVGEGLETKEVVQKKAAVTKTKKAAPAKKKTPTKKTPAKKK